MHSFTVKTKNPVAAAMLTEVSQYTEGVKESDHNLGSPPQHIFLGLLEGLIATGDKIGEPLITALTEIKKFTEQMEKEDREQFVRICSIRRTFQSDTKKVLLMIRPPEELVAVRKVEKEILTAMKKADFVLKTSQPPPGDLERQISKFLERQSKR